MADLVVLTEGPHTEVRGKGPSRNKPVISNADPSRLAALLVGYIPPVCALLAPCQAGASTPETTSLFPDGP